MAKPYASRTKTYNASDQVASADLNSIQDGIIATSDGVGDVAELSGSSIIADLLDPNPKLRIVPWAEGEPMLPAGAVSFIKLDGPPAYVQASSTTAGEWEYSLSKHLHQLTVTAITKIRCYFTRTSASASLSIELRRESLVTGADSLLQTFTASDSSGSWVSEATSTFDEDYDHDSYIYYLKLKIDCNAAITEVLVRCFEVEYEGQYIG